MVTTARSSRLSRNPDASSDIATDPGGHDAWSDLTSLRSAMAECASANIMFADRDLVLRYMNPSSVSTLNRLRHLLPVPPEEMIGRSIDTFHSDPAQQRQLLADPSRLPHRTEFQLGPETLQLTAGAVHDSDGDYIGSMVSWEIITEQSRKNADLIGQIEAINKVQAVISFELDGTIISANDNFLATLGYRLDEIAGKHHRMFVDQEYASSTEYRQFWSELGSSGDTPKTAVKSGFRHPTTRSLIPQAAPAGSSSSRPMSQLKSGCSLKSKQPVSAKRLRRRNCDPRSISC